MAVEASGFLILTGVGLAAAAGLNAYIPLLVAGLLAHFGVISIQSPYELLASWPALAILAVLLVIEFFADKIPAVDTLNDTVQTLVRPASGAVLFAGALAPHSEWSQALALIAGLATAGTVHAAKTAVRPVANVATGGVAAPVLSVVEDGFSLVLSVVAIVIPLLVIVLLVVLVYAMWRGISRVRTATSRSSDSATSSSG